MTRANNRLNPKFEKSLKVARENLKETHVYKLEGGKKVSDRVMINRNWLPPWREFYRPIKDRSEENQCNPKITFGAQLTLTPI